MNQLALPPAPAPSVPIRLDWDAMASLRQRILAHIDMPRYLLMPEVIALIEALDNGHQRMLLTVLWQTGARINEALALRPCDFYLDDPDQPYVLLKTLKQRGKGPGRPRTGQSQKPRLVPLLDPSLVVQLRRYFATHRLAKTKPVWAVTPQTVRDWLARAYRITQEQDQVIAFKPTPHTLRHSYAVHCVLHHVPVPVLQSWMGHRSRASTEIYTQVLGIEAYGLGVTINFGRVIEG